MSAPFIDGCLLLDGRFKVGQASIGGMDVNIPELGYPLLVGRVYDSRNRRDGSFGPGWSLPYEAANVQAEYTYAPSEGWGEEARGSFLTTYYIISQTRKVLALRLGDGAVFKFRMDLSPKSSLLYPIMDASFPLNVIYTPQDGTQATLEPIGVSNEVFLLSENGGTLMDWEGTEYAPTRFKLTLEDGTVYIINQQTGIERITDPYGHQISYSDSQIAHSSGDVLTIERDTSNRVERITDQLGRTIEYHYDENGMLEQVIQQGEGPYAMKVLENYAYQLADSGYFQGDETFARPILKDILAPDGTRLGTFEYDSQGRKTGLIDADGNRVLFGYDAPEHHYTVTDRRGNPTSYTYDSDGNVTAVTDAEGHTESYTYDANGNVLSKTDKAGYTTASTYDADDNKLTETDPLGHTTSFTYDSEDNKLSETNPLGQTTSYTYDSYGKMLTETNALGYTTEYTYNADGLRTSEKNALGNTTTFTYDAQGNLTSKTDPLGQTKEYRYNGYGKPTHIQDSEGTLAEIVYNADGKPVQVTEPLGMVVTLEYDALANLTKSIDQLGHVVQYTYDPNENITAKIDQEGHLTTYTYDENDQQIAETRTRTTPHDIETMTTLTEFDTLGRVIQRTDPAGNISMVEHSSLGMPSATIDKSGNRRELVYDPAGNISQVSFADGTTRSFTFDAAGRHIGTTDADGNTPSITYDEAGRPVKTTYPDGTCTETIYDAVGQVVKRIDERGNATTYTYDAAGQNTSMTDASGNTMSFTYSPRGQVTHITDSQGNVLQFEYDLNGRKTQTIFPDTTFIVYGYDEAGRVISDTDQAGNTTQYAYDKVGRLTKVIDALNHDTTYQYDEVGNLIAQTDARGNTTSFEYDHEGNMAKRTLPRGMSETMRYDSDGNLLAKTDFNGQTTHFAYNSLNQLVKKSFPDGTFVEYVYTNEGRPKEIRTEQGSTTYEYDSRYRLVKKTNSDGSTLSYTYDEAGNRTSITTPSGTVTYAFDAVNRLSSVTDAATETTTYTYNPVGNLQTVTSPNGTRAEYTYDTLNRLVSLVNRTSHGDILSSYAYTLNDAGKKTEVLEQTGRRITYAYDETGKVVEETIASPGQEPRVINYTYDEVGNRLTKTDNGVTTHYIYDDNNRLIQEGDITYSYDNNGNLIEKQRRNEQVIYHYNAENRLIQVDTTSLGITIVVKYEYDAEGNRVKKSIDDTVVITYLVDSNRDYTQVLEERDGADNLLARYVYGLDLISQTRNGITSYYQYDGMANTRAFTNSSQVVTDTYIYDAFGNLLDKTGTTTNTYLYRGEQFDANIMFYYLRARYMNPAIGRFITMDAFTGHLRDPYSVHKYLYANANPIQYIDPSGYQNLEEITALQPEQMEWTLRPLWVTSPSVITRIWAGLVLGLAGGAQIVGMSTWPYALDDNLYDVLCPSARVLYQPVGQVIRQESFRSGKSSFRILTKLDRKEYDDFDMILSWAIRKGFTELGGERIDFQGGANVRETLGVLPEHVGDFSTQEPSPEDEIPDPFVRTFGDLEIANIFIFARVSQSSGYYIKIYTPRMLGDYPFYYIPLAIVRNDMNSDLIPLSSTP